jgi:hypothetical protein
MILGLAVYEGIVLANVDNWNGMIPIIVKRGTVKAILLLINGGVGSGI